jgi:hypothetical protein
MAESHARASNPLTTTEVKRRRRIDQLTLDELTPLALLGGERERERWTPGRTARLTRAARATRLASDIPPSSSRDRRKR